MDSHVLLTEDTGFPGGSHRPVLAGGQLGFGSASSHGRGSVVEPQGLIPWELAATTTSELQRARGFAKRFIIFFFLVMSWRK